MPITNQDIFSLSPAHNPNYLPKIVKLEKFKPHPNANRLKIALVDGYDVIVSNSLSEGEIVLYFPLECQINEEFLSLNNEFNFDNYQMNSNREEIELKLHESHELVKEGKVDEGREKREEAKRLCGTFNDKGRVKAVRFRGELSQGWIVPAQEFLHRWIPGLDFNNLEEMIGVQFDTVGGKLLACKYEIKPKATQVQERLSPMEKRLRRLNRRDERLKSLPRLVHDQFHFHVDTLMLNDHYKEIKPDMKINISTKYHGTSCISARVLVKRKLSWKEKIKKLFFPKKVKLVEYGNIYSSRTVVKNGEFNPKKGGDYYASDIWGEANKMIAPYVNDTYTWYYEIIGYLPNTNKFIQDGYDYKNKEGEFSIRLYRVTTTDENGNVKEVPMSCFPVLCAPAYEKYQGRVKPVETLYEGTAGELYPDIDITRQYLALYEELDKAFHNNEDITPIQEKIYNVLAPWQDEFLSRLKKDKRFHMEEDSPDCNNKVPHEGIVIRVLRESRSFPIQVYKLKCNRFYEYESKTLDKGEKDIESNA